MTDEQEKLIETLRGFSRAYPEDIFRPMDDATLEEIHEKCPGAIDRISAGMGRHCAKFMDQAADSISLLERRIAELEQAIKNLEKVKGRYHSEQAYKELLEVYKKRSP